jgi:hypothetical protein
LEFTTCHRIAISSIRTACISCHTIWSWHEARVTSMLRWDREILYWWARCKEAGWVVCFEGTIEHVSTQREFSFDFLL